jgi:hypothetical protein
MALPDRKDNKLGSVKAILHQDSWYINVSLPSLRYRGKFAKAQKVGHFQIFIDKIFVQPSPETWFTFPQACYLNMKTGRKHFLNRIEVRKTIKDNYALLQHYKRNPNRRDNLISYLRAYSEGLSNI